MSEDTKETLMTIFWFLASCVAVYSLYIGMVLEPECERKGYAGVHSKGCYIIIDGKTVYEK